MQASGILLFQIVLRAAPLRSLRHFGPRPAKRWRSTVWHAAVRFCLGFRASPAHHMR